MFGLNKQNTKIDNVVGFRSESISHRYFIITIQIFMNKICGCYSDPILLWSLSKTSLYTLTF